MMIACECPVLSYHGRVAAMTEDRLRSGKWTALVEIHFSPNSKLFSKFQNDQFHHHHHRRSGISSQVGVMMPHLPVATVYAWTSDHLSNSAVPLCDAGRAGSSNSTTSSTP